MLSSCPFLCTVTKCDHASCDRPAFLAAYSCNDARFCSSEHQEESVPLKVRELERLDSLLNKILLLKARALHGYRTFWSELTGSGVLVLYQEQYDEPLGNNTPAVHQAIEEIGFCFNSCVHAMETLAGVIAYFAEGIAAQSRSGIELTASRALQGQRGASARCRSLNINFHRRSRHEG